MTQAQLAETCFAVARGELDHAIGNDRMLVSLDWETPCIPDMEWVLEFMEVFTRTGISVEEQTDLIDDLSRPRVPLETIVRTTRGPRLELSPSELRYVWETRDLSHVERPCSFLACPRVNSENPQTNASHSFAYPREARTISEFPSRGGISQGNVAHESVPRTDFEGQDGENARAELVQPACAHMTRIDPALVLCS
jgi:hypothetical protein